MKQTSSIFKTSGLLLALMIITGSAIAQINIPPAMQKSIVSNRLPAHIQLTEAQMKKIMIKKIDLSASKINFTIIKCKDRFNAHVVVEGVVKNTGGLAYSSNANQQSALLYEDNGGRLQLVASQSFQNLAPGAEVKVSYTRPWNRSSPAEGEFPPNYVLVIGFDPDIYIDGNDSNDDSNYGNNRFTRSAAEVNSNWTCK
ncbi:hypothetical protein [Chitinophaga niabensis]|uniref:CARDB protein n=1 Tax=Chitinophaga niabensis TaxID=536979 RepID=A0A1N6K6C9_9BACT|nr:hypothetical protein [Chitinophaga niabensis]SIO52152.1 hypothetical protein SAMN04488055_5178 [Chitinophaga niabensis]